jgi:hypothetical protein
VKRQSPNFGEGFYTNDGWWHSSELHWCNPVPQVSPDLCRLVEEVAPHFRLSWRPESERSNLEEGFAACELWPVREREEKDPFIGVIVPGTRPVYGSPWDTSKYVLVDITDVDEDRVANWMVVTDFYVWSRPFKERELSLRQKQGEDMERAYQDLVGEIGEYLYFNGHKDPSRGNVVARKHLSEYERRVLSGDAAGSFSDAYTNRLPANGIPLA